jgi:hypothetical protein
MKDKRFELRIDAKTLDRIKQKAGALNMSVADYLIFVAMNAIINCSVGKTFENETIGQQLEFLSRMKMRGDLNETQFEAVKNGMIAKYTDGIPK